MYLGKLPIFCLFRFATVILVLLEYLFSSIVFDCYNDDDDDDNMANEFFLTIFKLQDC